MSAAALATLSLRNPVKRRLARLADGSTAPVVSDASSGLIAPFVTISITSLSRSVRCSTRALSTV